MGHEDRDALYYPHIHIRDPKWLAGTLLIFPRVVRMVPDGFRPQDDLCVAEFAKQRGRRGPLLDRIDLGYSETRQSLQLLLERFEAELNRDEAGFQQRFGEVTARSETHRDSLGFQLRFEKAPELLDCLWRHGLGWRPWNREPDDPSGYL